MKTDWFNFSEYRSQLKRDASVLAVCFITSLFLLGIYFCVQYGVEIDVICNRFLK